MFNIEKNSEEFKHSSNLKHKRFIEVPENANFQNLIKSPNPTPPLFISLPRPQRPYIQKGIEEKG